MGTDCFSNSHRDRFFAEGGKPSRPVGCPGRSVVPAGWSRSVVPAGRLSRPVGPGRLVPAGWQCIAIRQPPFANNLPRILLDVKSDNEKTRPELLPAGLCVVAVSIRSPLACGSTTHRQTGVATFRG